MTYARVCKAVFLDRPNRFIAHVELQGRVETVHVKNTGRCRELLLPGTAVVLSASDKPRRKTAYDLVSVLRDGQWINIDSQAPNIIAKEYLPLLYPDLLSLHAEYRHGDSRLDFMLETERGRVYVEVKGVTLLNGEAALFPDAPTIRGVKHLGELSACVAAGDRACLLFVVQMKRAAFVAPNCETHPAFGFALEKAMEAGVDVKAVDCIVTEKGMIPHQPVPVRLR